MISTLPRSHGPVLGLRVSGRLHDEDYRKLEALATRILRESGRIRLLAWLDDFHGWDLPAAWDDLRFGVHHYHDVERLAMVGQRQWEKWMAQLARPLIRARVRYFDHDALGAAWNWIEEGLPAADVPPPSA